MPHSAPGPAARRSGDRGFRAFTTEDLDVLTARAGLTPGQRLRIRAAAAVLGFRTTSYVTSELIDWSAAPDDPIYRLVFPDEDMLPGAEIARIAGMTMRILRIRCSPPERWKAAQMPGGKSAGPPSWARGLRCAVPPRRSGMPNSRASRARHAGESPASAAISLSVRSRCR